jgi:transcription initiation factor IIE alpha subunit
MYETTPLYKQAPKELTHEEREHALRRLPPSAKLVYKALDDKGAMTSKEISEETMLAPRTVRHALKRLRHYGLVNTRASLRDCRTAYFFLGKNCNRV